MPTTAEALEFFLIALVALIFALAVMIRHSFALFVNPVVDELLNLCHDPVRLLLESDGRPTLCRDCIPFLLRIEPRRNSVSETQFRGFSEKCHMLSKIESVLLHREKTEVTRDRLDIKIYLYHIYIFDHEYNKFFGIRVFANAAGAGEPCTVCLAEFCC